MATKTGTSGNDSLVGTTVADILKGLAGDDQLTGGSAADKLDGGKGIDTVHYDASTKGVVINQLFHTAHLGDAEGDTLVGVENVTGSAFNDSIRGDALANVLKGLAGADELHGDDGNDTLVGGAGADFLDGGDGVDTASYSGSSAELFADLAIGTAHENGLLTDSYLSIENLIGIAKDDTLLGSATDNRLDGGKGDDLLSGRDGNDVIHGGDGDDRVNGGFGSDVLDGGKGIDSLDYFNSVSGVSVNLATGLTGGDEAAGDIITGFENVFASNSNDTLIGDGSQNILAGGAGTDIVFGAGGKDELSGDGGTDQLTGGSDGDTFIFFNSQDSSAGAGIRDTITDFSHAQGDRIDLSPIDANSTTSDQFQRFEFFGKDGLFDAPGQFRYIFVGTNTVVQVNTEGGFASAPEMEIELPGHVDLVASDFIF